MPAEALQVPVSLTRSPAKRHAGSGEHESDGCAGHVEASVNVARAGYVQLGSPMPDRNALTVTVPPTAGHVAVVTVEAPTL